MNKKTQIKELEAKYETLKKEHFDTLEELNKVKEDYRKERESSDYWKDQWEKQLHENCDRQRQEDWLNNIACMLANAYIIAKAVNPQTNVRFDSDTMIENNILASVCVETAKSIMKRTSKIQYPTPPKTE